MRYTLSVLGRLALLLVLTLVALASSPYQISLPKVELKRVPEGGIQPQVAVDEDGEVHLVYFKGDPLNGDLFYAHSEDGERFSTPLRVNSEPGTAIAVGNIRGARLAAGRYGSVYVTWNGSESAARANGGRAPMLYTRLNASHNAFEPERNLIRSAYGIDGGGGIAADEAGRVFVFWHAPLAGKEGEVNRRVWMARSEDDGKTFESERVAWSEPTGACGCCSLDALADKSGHLFVLFRTAREQVHRDMYLLRSDDGGNAFKGLKVSPWNVGYCVMSTEALAGVTDGLLAAWETEKQVHFGRMKNGGLEISDLIAGRNGNQKYPSVATNRSGITLLSWTEGMGWKHGGSLHWQVFDRSDKPAGPPGSSDGVPVWSLIASYSRRDGTFVVLY